MDSKHCQSSIATFILLGKVEILDSCNIGARVLLASVADDRHLYSRRKLIVGWKRHFWFELHIRRVSSAWHRS